MRDAPGKGKLALLIPTLAGGGAERVMLTLAAALAERGYPVDLVVTRAQGALIDEVPATVRLVDLGARRIRTSLPALTTYLRGERPCAMLSALWQTNCLAAWARVIARARTRLVLSEHNTFTAAGASTTGMRGRLLARLMRRSYARADGIVAVSQGVADDLAPVIGLARDRVHVIYNPIVTGEMLKKAREPLDHPWFREGEPPVILGVGRLTPQKDFPTLIRAFEQLRRSRAARLIILGEGEKRPNLEALVRRLHVESDVALPGFTHNPYVYMAHCAVLALSSRCEGLPSVLVEAMACGTPVVATDCPSGPSEILQDGQFGRLVPVGDPSAFAEALLAALQHSQLPPGARDRAMSFDVRSACDGYLMELFPALAQDQVVPGPGPTRSPVMEQSHSGSAASRG